MVQAGRKEHGRTTGDSKDKQGLSTEQKKKSHETLLKQKDHEGVKRKWGQTKTNYKMGRVSIFNIQSSQAINKPLANLTEAGT